MINVASDDRELRDDKGQHCTTCDQHFKYQYLYDDHVPCRAARPFDPTTDAIAAWNDERDRLRAENDRLRALVEESCGELDDTGGEFAAQRAVEIRREAGIETVGEIEARS